MNLPSPSNSLNLFANLDRPEVLEALYHKNPEVFKSEFYQIWPELQNNLTAQCWKARLEYIPAHKKTHAFPKSIFIWSALSALASQIPWIFKLNEPEFFSRNIGFLFIPLFWGIGLHKSQASIKKMGFFTLVLTCSVLYINLIPENSSSQSLLLSCIHMPLFLWACSSIAFNFESEAFPSLRFLRFNADWIVFTALLVIAGMLFSVLTLGLFNFIGISLESVYFQHVALPAFCFLWSLSGFTVYPSNNLIGKVAPQIVKWVSPFVLFVLIVYLPATVFSSESPYTDRDFFILINFTLLAILAIVIFLISSKRQNIFLGFEKIVLLGLIGLSIALDAWALSALAYRISEWGISANKTAVLLENVCILMHLIAIGLFQLFKSDQPRLLESITRRFLIVYALVFAAVCFLFPWVFK